MCCDSGSSSPPPAPDYTAMAMASKEAAQTQAQTAKEQLSWAKDQWSQQWPITQQYMQKMMDTSDAQTQMQREQMSNAEKDRARYESTYQPLENQLVTTAQGWNSPARSARESGAAMGDVATAFDQQRKSSLATLESYGIDPSQTRFGALDLGTRVAQAAATAAAGTQSRKNTEATGLGLLSEAINIGKGYPGQVSQSYAGATQAGGGAANTGAAGINAGLSTGSTYSNMMGSPLGWTQASNSAMGTTGNTMVGGYKAAVEGSHEAAQQQGNMMQGIGSLIGGAAAIAMM